MSYTMRIDGIDAIVTYDQNIGKFRGEFCGLSGGADTCKYGAYHTFTH